MSGMEAFEKLHRIDSRVPVILMTGRGTAQTAIEAMQRGAFEYFVKPFDPDSLIKVVEEAAIPAAWFGHSPSYQSSRPINFPPMKTLIN